MLSYPFLSGTALVYPSLTPLIDAPDVIGNAVFPRVRGIPWFQVYPLHNGTNPYMAFRSTHFAAGQTHLLFWIYPLCSGTDPIIALDLPTSQWDRPFYRFCPPGTTVVFLATR